MQSYILNCHLWRGKMKAPVPNKFLGSPPGSPVPGILQARTLEWVAISFSSAWKGKVKVKSLSPVQLSQPHGLQPTRLLRPWDFPGKSTGVGCHCFLQAPVPNKFSFIYFLASFLPTVILHCLNSVYTFF